MGVGAAFAGRPIHSFGLSSVNHMQNWTAIYLSKYNNRSSSTLVVLPAVNSVSMELLSVVYSNQIPVNTHLLVCSSIKAQLDCLHILPVFKLSLISYRI